MKTLALICGTSAVLFVLATADASATTVKIRTEASKGYQFYLKASDRVHGGRARVELTTNHAGVTYIPQRKIEVSPRQLRIDLGPRGEVALRFRQRGSSRCGPDVARHRGMFNGKLEFAGEHGYSEVDLSRVPGSVFFKRPCPERDVQGRHPQDRAEKRVRLLIGCGPEPNSFLYAERANGEFWGLAGTLEERPYAKISRYAIMAGEMSALRVSRDLQRGVLRPSGNRFTGVARYARRRTSGDLMAYLPGRSWVEMVPGRAIINKGNTLGGPRCSR